LSIGEPGSNSERPENSSAERRMKNFWKISPWLSRLIILAVAALFTVISLKFILDPRAAASNSGIMLEPGVGYTNTRAGFGGFPLGFAVILVYCLFSSRRLLSALSFIATIAAAILAVRLYGAAEDATFSQSAHLLIPETILLVVSLLGVVVEMKRRNHYRAAA
jgi:membrane protein YdbS with pleckstrin-like domain